MVLVEIKNFQSIAHETIEIDGFSALVGRSNIGKSAIVRAIKAALSGSPVDSYVRHDINCPRIKSQSKSCKCFCSVRIKSEGLDLLWEKGDAVNQYTYNGSKYTVVGRGTPDFLAQGFAPVKLGDEKEIIQVSDQFRPIFILDKSGTVVADVLSDVAKLNQINVAMRMVEKDRRETSSTRKIREEDVSVLHASLLHYEGLDEVVNKVTGLESLDQQVELRSVKMEQLEAFIEVLFNLVGQLKGLEGITSVVIPIITPLDSAYASLTILEGLNASLVSTSGAVEQLNGVENIAPPNILSLDDSYACLTTLEELTSSLVGKSEAVEGLNGVENIVTPNIESLLSLGNAYEKLVQWDLDLDLLRKFFDRFKQFDSVPFPILDSFVSIKENYFRLDSWASRVDEVSSILPQVQTELDKANQEESDVLNEFKALGVCYTCNRPFVEDHKDCGVR